MQPRGKRGNRGRKKQVSSRYSTILSSISILDRPRRVCGLLRRIHESRLCNSDCLRHVLIVGSKHVIQPTVSDLVKVMGIHEQTSWNVELVTDESFLVLQSRVRRRDDTWTVATQLWIQLQPFQISAVQQLGTVSPWQGLHRFTSSEKDACVRLQTTPGSRPAVVWQTKQRGIRYQGTATILSLEKPSTARYFGWGEQGGRSFAKDKVTMNYFSRSYKIKRSSLI